MMDSGRLETRSVGRFAMVAGLVFVVAMMVFGSGLSREPLFVDEAAFVSQSYFWDLAISGRVDDPRWLEFPAYDLPPLPKYLIGAALQVRGIARCDRASALSWYANIKERRFLSDSMLHAARWPSAICGALGCVAILAIGAIAANMRTGVLAALLLMANPLYRLHAMRAMADAPAEMLILMTSMTALAYLVMAMAGRATILRSLMFGIMTGVLAGLAVLAKLNGGLGLMIVASWVTLGVIFPPAAHRSRVRAHLLVMFATCGITALVTFIALNPFVTARPSRLPAYPLAEAVPSQETIAARIQTILRHRLSVPRNQQTIFPHNALTTPTEKFKALAVQGFGRFGPLGPLHTDSTRRYDRSQDWGAWLWIPMVLAGYVWAIARGARAIREGTPPVTWAIGLLAIVAMVTVGVMLPLAWDRYFLSIQAGSALLAAGGIVWGIDAIRSRGVTR